MKQNAVVTNFQQDFDADEKAMGRANIDAASTALVTTDEKGLMSASDKAKLDSIEPQQKSDWLADRGITEILNKPYIGKQFTAVVYDQTTFDELTAILAGGYNPILVDSSGNYMGQFKYASASLAIFERYHVQPMWMCEYRLTASGWSTYTFYTTDMASPKVYTVDRVSTEFKQSALPKMWFDVTSYLSATPWQYQGADISGTMFDEIKSNKPQLMRFDYSSDLAYCVETLPAGTPTAVLTVELVMTVTPTQSGTPTDYVQDWAPKVVIPFTGFASDGQGHYVSAEKPLNYSVTFDRQRFESIFDSAYYVHFWLRGTVSNISLSDSYHWLRQVVAHSQYTMMSHV